MNTVQDTGRISKVQQVIIQTAFRLLQDGGLASLSMRKIATEIGIQASALYWHFPNKQTILAAMAEQLLAEFSLPTAVPQEDNALLNEVVKLREVLLSYRDGAELVATSVAFQLVPDVVEKRLADLLTPHKQLSDSKKNVIIATLLHFTYGHTRSLQERETAIRFGAEIAGTTDLKKVREGSDEEFVDAVALILSGIDNFGAKDESS